MKQRSSIQEIKNILQLLEISSITEKQARQYPLWTYRTFLLICKPCVTWCYWSNLVQVTANTTEYVKGENHMVDLNRRAYKWRWCCVCLRAFLIGNEACVTGFSVCQEWEGAHKGEEWSHHSSGSRPTPKPKYQHLPHSYVLSITTTYNEP